MTFRDKFKQHVSVLRMVNEEAFGAAFEKLGNELAALAAAGETGGAAAISGVAIDAMVRAAALLYVAGERAERATGEDAAP